MLKKLRAFEEPSKGVFGTSLLPLRFLSRNSKTGEVAKKYVGKKIQFGKLSTKKSFVSFCSQETNLGVASI